MGNATFISQGQRRHLSPDRGQYRARPLLCPYPLASGLHERAAYLYDRSVLRRCFRRLVGQQRRRLRPRLGRGGACRQLCASRGWNSALRRSHPQPERAGSHRDLRYRSSQLCACRSIETTLAGGVIDDSNCAVMASPLGSQSRTVLRWRYRSTHSGTVKRTSAPCGARGDADRRPPWASTMDRQIASPMPRPSDFVVKKVWNMRSATAGSSPVPVSCTATSTLLGSASLEDIVSSLERSVTPFMASTPFIIKFKTTCCN